MTRHYLAGAMPLGDVAPATDTDIIVLIAVLAVVILGVIYERRQIDDR